jgi:hypothetical protein
VRLGALLVLAALGAAASEAASAKGALVLEPSSPWILDYDADSCALRRMFGEGDKSAQVEFRRFGPGLDLQTRIVTNALNTTDRNFRFRLDPTQEWKTVDQPIYIHFDEKFRGVIFTRRLVEGSLGRNATPKDWSEFLLAADYRSLESEAMAPVEGITVSRAFSRDLTLRTGSLVSPLAALNECVDELTTHWGIDFEAHKTLSRRATPVNVPRAAQMLDYPPRMLEKGMPGLVNIRLDVDAAGVVTDCHIQMPLSDPEFEKESCTKLKRVLKFDPALDKEGSAIPSYWVNSVRFVIR